MLDKSNAEFAKLTGFLAEILVENMAVFIENTKCNYLDVALATFSYVIADCVVGFSLGGEDASQLQDRLFNEINCAIEKVFDQAKKDGRKGVNSKETQTH